MSADIRISLQEEVYGENTPQVRRFLRILSERLRPMQMIGVLFLSPIDERDYYLRHCVDAAVLVHSYDREVDRASYRAYNIAWGIASQYKCRSEATFVAADMIRRITAALVVRQWLPEEVFARIYAPISDLIPLEDLE